MSKKSSAPEAAPKSTPAVAAWFDLSDDANADRFVQAVEHRLRYRSDAGTWMRWNPPGRLGDHHEGGWWSEETDAEALQLAREVAREVEEAAILAAGGSTIDQQRAAAVAGRGCRSRSRMASMVALAKGDRRLTTRSEQWNADPWLLNVANGTLDLRTGDLSRHRAADLISTRSTVVHDPNATCPTWERFIDEITCGDAELAGFLQRAVGSSITGVIRDQVMFVLHGSGRNGKSTLLEVLLELVGRDLGIRAERALLVRSHRSGGGPTGGQADLFGKRLVVTSETSAGDRLDEGLVKDLTGGDRIRARHPYGRNFEFSPTHHIWMPTNHFMRITGTDTGIWRRICVIPFNAQIPDKKVDTGLGITLRAELAGILNWATQGCLNWQQHGLGNAKAVTDATTAYRTNEDLLGAYLDERCITDTAASVATADLYADYRNWAETSGVPPLSKIHLGRLLAQRDEITATQIGTDRARSWSGLRLRTPDDPDTLK